MAIPAPAAEQILRIAAASDLRFALDEIVVAFREASPDANVRVSYGSSGNFYAQLTQRAPFDLFFSADVSYAARLGEAGAALPDSLFSYAVGRLVIWAPSKSPISPAELQMMSLQHPGARKIAIANPEHAPYGHAAVAAMRSAGVYDAVQDRLVLGENVAQAAMFVESGSADIGIIALALALAPPMQAKGSYWEIPQTAFPRLEQAGVILRWTRQPELARAFRDFVIGEEGRRILRRHGFFMPEE